MPKSEDKRVRCASIQVILLLRQNKYPNLKTDKRPMVSVNRMIYKFLILSLFLSLTFLSDLHSLYFEPFPVSYSSPQIYTFIISSLFLSLAVLSRNGRQLEIRVLLRCYICILISVICAKRLNEFTV